jgi:hypothetical protein
VQIKQQMIDWWGPIVDEYYASSEAIGSTLITAEDWLEHPGSVGRPMGGALHILGEDGNELPPGQPGEIYFESGASFEYLNDAEKTAASRHERGWMTVGDIGYLDEDGYLYLTTANRGIAGASNRQGGFLGVPEIASAERELQLGPKPTGELLALGFSRSASSWNAVAGIASWFTRRTPALSTLATDLKTAGKIGFFALRRDPDGATLDAVGDRVEERQVRGLAVPVADAVDHTPQPAGALATRRALAAGLLVIKVGQPKQRLHRAARLVHDDDRARAEHRPGLGDRVVIHVGRHHDLGRQHRHR